MFQSIYYAANALNTLSYDLILFYFWIMLDGKNRVVNIFAIAMVKTCFLFFEYEFFCSLAFVCIVCMTYLSIEYAKRPHEWSCNLCKAIQIVIQR